MIRQNAAEFLKERIGEKMLTITTTEIFEEIAAIFDVDEGAERQLKGILMQLGEHIVIDDFKEEEWRLGGRLMSREQIKKTVFQ